MKKAVVSLSGGMDSTTVLWEAVSQQREVHPVLFQYGSKHNKYEQQAVKNILLHRGVSCECPIINIGAAMQAFKSNLLKSGGDIPEGHYEESSMSQTVVPSRNIIFISILSGYAWSIGADEIWLGIHAGDHLIYPDCRPDFFFAMKEAIGLGTDGRVDLVAPFLHMDKTQILKRGFELDVPYELTRTCYKDQPTACGKCGSCQERLEAFKNNSLPDPIHYDSRELMPKTF